MVAKNGTTSRFLWASLAIAGLMAAGLVAMAGGPRATGLGTEWFVAAGGSGVGTRGAPFGRVQDALFAAHAGDTITLEDGTYVESLRTMRGGDAGREIRLRASGNRGSVVVTAKGRVLTINHPHIVVEGLVLDGQYGSDDTVRVGHLAHFVTLRNIEVRRSGHDLIDMGGVEGMLIEHSLLHHALNAAEGRADAHGIVAGAVRNLTIRDTEIHTFSGDGIQLDPTRSAPGWDDVTVEGCRIWLAPLPAAENGFAAGVVPGENAVDTKASPQHPRAMLRVLNTTAWGFRNGLVANMAAFNLKENIDATLDGVTVYDSEIAFRVRGPASEGAAGARITIKNAVVHDTGTAFRYEDNIERFNVWNATLGRRVTRAFRGASSDRHGLDVRNLLVRGRLPAWVAGPSNLAADAGAFVGAATGDYRLAPGSAAIDAGVTIPDVSIDREGRPRPQGRAYDIGAYERRQP